MQCDDAFTRNGWKEPSECSQRSQICMRLLTSCTLPLRFCVSRTEVTTTIALRLPYYNATTISWQTEKNKWEKQRRLLTKLDWFLVYWRRTPNHSKKTDGNVKHTGIEQTTRKTWTSRKSEKEESRKWTMCLVDSINTQKYNCRSFLLPGNSEIQQLERKSVQSVNKTSGVERQPMMQTNKILYGVSKRSSSRKPDLQKPPEMLVIKLNDSSTPWIGIRGNLEIFGTNCSGGGFEAASTTTVAARKWTDGPWKNGYGMLTYVSDPTHDDVIDDWTSFLSKLCISIWERFCRFWERGHRLKHPRELGDFRNEL
jgi:hypothetical protein